MDVEPQSGSDRPTPSEHVRLEADLATGSLSESVWVKKEATPHRPTVLVVEANADLRARAAAKLSAAGLRNGDPAFRVRTAGGPRRAAAVIERIEVDLILCGKPGTPEDAQSLLRILHNDARFSRAARVMIGATHRAASVLREPLQVRLVGEVLVDLADGSADRGPPSIEQ